MRGKKTILQCLELMATFFKIGAFTFGGGFAMIPLIEREVVERKKWMDKETFIDSISLTQSAPGAIAINLAIFLGHNLAGTVGAFAAALGVALPSFLIILAIAAGLGRLQSPIVESAFKGVRAAVVALVVYAGLKMGRRISWSPLFVAISTATFAAVVFLDVSPVVMILLAAGLAAVCYRRLAGQGVYGSGPAKQDEKSTNTKQHIEG